MNTFIHSDIVKNLKAHRSLKRCNDFINKINSKINRAKYNDTSVSLNTSLDEIEHLSPADLKYLIKLAKEQGWNLTSFEDNCHTTTYRLEIK